MKAQEKFKKLTRNQESWVAGLSDVRAKRAISGKLVSTPHGIHIDSPSEFRRCKVSVSRDRPISCTDQTFDGCTFELQAYAHFTYCTFTDCDFSGADLTYSSFVSCAFVNCEFGNMTLDNTDFVYCSMTGCRADSCNVTGRIYASGQCRSFLARTVPMECPRKGAYTAYKKAVSWDDQEVLVTLEIPREARRSSATGKKCRASMATVRDIRTVHGNRKRNFAISFHDPCFTYRTGQTVRVDNFDTNRFNECAPGIHHFMDPESAMDY